MTPAQQSVTLLARLKRKDTESTSPELQAWHSAPFHERDSGRKRAQVAHWAPEGHTTG